MLFVEDVGGQAVDDAFETIFRYGVFVCHQQVPELYRLMKEFLIIVDDDQSTRQRIFGVEQPGVYLAVVQQEVLAQHAII